MTATIKRGKIVRPDLANWDGKTATATRIDSTGGTTTGLAIGNEVDVLQVYGSGTDRTVQTITNALNYINTSSVTLVFAPGTWLIDANVTIGANFTCHIPAGCVFSVSSGKTLTFSGLLFTESPSTWYSGAGTVVVSNEGSHFGIWHRTSAERSASVTPTYYYYPPGNPGRYAQLGTSSAYATGLTAAMGTYSEILYNGTAQTGAGVQGYHQRYQAVTEAGVDVGSTVGLASIMQAYSTNSGGTATNNNTNQIAALFNSSAMNTAASAGVYGINAIATSAYIGVGSQTVCAGEFDVSVPRTGDVFGSTTGQYSLGIAVQSVGSFSATTGIAVDTSHSGTGWLNGMVLSGCVNNGIVVARNTVTPANGIWVSAATTYGIYVGAKALSTLNAGQVPAFDGNHNPSVGICLGEIAATSGNSNKLRFASTDGGSVEKDWDVYHYGSTTLNFDYGGSTKVGFGPSGQISIQGTQILTTRRTGWTAWTGTPTRTTIATGSATATNCAEAIKALVDDLIAHGVIGT